MKAPFFVLLLAFLSAHHTSAQDIAARVTTLEQTVETFKKEFAAMKAELANLKSTANALAQQNEALKEQAVPVGSIQAYAGDKIPDGWKLCDGTELEQSDYPKLYNAIGRDWGGSGTKFRLPDLQGRFLRGVAGTKSADPDKDNRTSLYAGGNRGNQVGSYQSDEFERHNHPMTKDRKVLEWSRQEPKGTHSSPAGTFEGLNMGNTETLYKVGEAGGSETRPTNAYAHFIIKSE